jgi:hypothetical protein
MNYSGSHTGDVSGSDGAGARRTAAKIGSSVKTGGDHPGNIGSPLTRFGIPAYHLPERRKREIKQNLPESMAAGHKRGITEHMSMFVLHK